MDMPYKLVELLWVKLSVFAVIMDRYATHDTDI